MPIQSVFITGANTGLGKEAARQFALIPTIESIILGCRNETKAKAAKADLEQSTGRDIFKIVIIDVSDFDSVRAAVEKLNQPVDALILNAGGVAGGANHQNLLSKYGATNMVTINVLGHILLTESMIEQGKLKQVAMYASSFAAVGVPLMGVARPTLESHLVEDYRSLINGSFFENKKEDVLLAYGYTKMMACQWMASASRKFPEVRFVSVSPGSTTGTEGAKDSPQPFKFMLEHMGFVFRALGVMHHLEVGVARYVDVTTDESYGTGHFYASKCNRTTGEMIRWDETLDYLGNKDFQDNCSEALHEFITAE